MAKLTAVVNFAIIFLYCCSLKKTTNKIYL